MCGIAGLWTTHLHAADSLRVTAVSMADRIVHRGPDACGHWEDNQSGIALAHRRLAIIDLSERADQPMTSPSGNSRIVFNGEIYNFASLRHELVRDGVEFSNNSDTEAIVALYDRLGIGCLQRLRGMFAFAVWDARQRQLILARDRVGKKPLYYWAEHGLLCFASEIKAVLAALPTAPSVDELALREYLQCGFIGGERTIYKGVHELPPGCCLVANSPQEFTIQRFWSPQWTKKIDCDFDQAVERIDDALSDAVRLRLRADVPVGVFLSGGIDSALVVAMGSRIVGSGLKTFSVGFDDAAQYDERPLARLVAERYGTDHHEIVLRPNVESILPKIAWHHDEPFADASAIPSFAIAQYARQHVKVVLNGDGGDELFAGYRRHVAAAAVGRLQRLIGFTALRHSSRFALRVLPRPTDVRGKYALTYRLVKGLCGSPEERLITWHGQGFTCRELAQASNPHVAQCPGDNFFTRVLASVESLGELDKMLAVDFLWELPGDLLVKMDIATMASGMEARSPFLDQELVELANSLSERVRLGGTASKPLLRALAQRYLPSELVNAPKRGFEVPLHRWLTNDLRSMRDDLVLARGGICCSLFSRPYLEQLLQSPDVEPGRWSQLVWILLMLAAWEAYGCRRASDAVAVGPLPPSSNCGGADGRESSCG